MRLLRGHGQGSLRGPFRGVRLPGLQRSQDRRSQDAVGCLPLLQRHGQASPHTADVLGLRWARRHHVGRPHDEVHPVWGHGQRARGGPALQSLQRHRPRARQEVNRAETKKPYRLEGPIENSEVAKPRGATPVGRASGPVPWSSLSNSGHKEEKELHVSDDVRTTSDAIVDDLTALLRKPAGSGTLTQTGRIQPSTVTTWLGELLSANGKCSGKRGKQSPQARRAGFGGGHFLCRTRRKRSASASNDSYVGARKPPRSGSLLQSGDLRPTSGSRSSPRRDACGQIGSDSPLPRRRWNKPSVPCVAEPPANRSQ